MSEKGLEQINFQIEKKVLNIMKTAVKIDRYF
ncbi:hypothetical protein NTHI1209_00444 [Haemophilus influenzae]|uniref:Uncharacterized protein n=1 Tax=Haemophilus influenzae TaxID=727 RepID=A0A158SVE7_HAEIF|nr:hypothetical protein NTHI1209_00444 [Haemophilus influenzae]